jgi:hypothetical protein
MDIGAIHPVEQAAPFCRLHRVTAAALMLNFAAAGDVRGVVQGMHDAQSALLAMGKAGCMFGSTARLPRLVTQV